MARIRKPRRRLSMTSLIDVIFLLLLFFMLTSTFSKFSEVELASAAGSAQAAPSDAADATPVPVIVSLGADVTAQRLTDLLVALRQIPGATPTILGDPA